MIDCEPASSRMAEVRGRSPNRKFEGNKMICLECLGGKEIAA
jgi:hypothetical protein